MISDHFSISDLGIPKSESTKQGTKNRNPIRQAENNLKVAAVSFAKGMHRNNLVAAWQVKKCKPQRARVRNRSKR